MLLIRYLYLCYTFLDTILTPYTHTIFTHKQMAIGAPMDHITQTETERRWGRRRMRPQTNMPKC